MVLHATVGKLGTNLSDYLPLIESIVYWSQHDMLHLLMNTALLSDSIEQDICLKAIIHYLSPVDIGEKPVKHVHNSTDEITIYNIFTLKLEIQM